MLRRSVVGLGVAIGVLTLAWSAAGEEVAFRICAWNVESGGAQANVIAARIAEEDGVDIWGLSEVRNDSDAELFEQAAESDEGADYRRVVGTTGGSDRLAVLYDADRFDAISVDQLHALNIGGNVRAPLVVELEERVSNQRFLFVVNHLYRGSASGRHEQSRRLNQWAHDQELPVVTVGDFNYDFHYVNGDTDHDEGLDLLTEDDVFLWVRPAQLVPTNSSSHQSVLDFVFVSGEAIEWNAESRILRTPGDFPDGPTRSDHRPVDAVFAFDADEEIEPLEVRNSPSRGFAPDAAPFDRALDEFRRPRQARTEGEGDELSDAQILARLGDIEAELGRLRQALERRGQR